MPIGFRQRKMYPSPYVRNAGNAGSTGEGKHGPVSQRQESLPQGAGDSYDLHKRLMTFITVICDLCSCRGRLMRARLGSFSSETTLGRTWDRSPQTQGSTSDQGPASETGLDCDQALSLSASSQTFEGRDLPVVAVETSLL
ncbi:hypothetical protein SKAU_G00322800 [Synaphobranchus kaupii]|uniref:Uncharacterized protein n=1 Tax=Synaphobranchus kaupii TaxID=118154 RepID=A0A9Q1EP46_SYNKA|nr:hypothetical protein SKAU_G00322800 [Synaphobranchus kaupii]